MSAIRYTAPGGWVTAVQGRPPDHRSPTAPRGPAVGEIIHHGPDAPIQWTTVGGVDPRRSQSPSRRPPATRAATNPQASERRAARRSDPDYRCYAVVVPYGVELDDGRGHRLLFSTRTSWSHKAVVPLQLEHESGRGLVGHAIPISETNGLVCDARIYGRLRRRVGDRNHVSVGLGEFNCLERADGVYEVMDAELREVSLVTTARWAEHSQAAIWQAA